MTCSGCPQFESWCSEDCTWEDGKCIGIELVSKRRFVQFFGWHGSFSSSSSSSSEESDEWWNNRKNAANVQFLAHKCGHVAKNILSGSDVASVVNTFEPMLNQKLSNQDVLTMTKEMNHYKSTIQKLADCIGQKSGWDWGIEVPKALSIGIAVGAGK